MMMMIIIIIIIVIITTTMYIVLSVIMTKVIARVHPVHPIWQFAMYIATPLQELSHAIWDQTVLPATRQM